MGGYIFSMRCLAMSFAMRAPFGWPAQKMNSKRGAFLEFLKVRDFLRKRESKQFLELVLIDGEQPMNAGHPLAASDSIPEEGALKDDANTASASHCPQTRCSSASPNWDPRRRGFWRAAASFRSPPPGRGATCRAAAIPRYAPPQPISAGHRMDRRTGRPSSSRIRSA